MKTHLQKLVTNFALLWKLSNDLNISLSVRVSYQESVRKFSDFLRLHIEKIPNLVSLPQGLVIEDDFYPYSTYFAFMGINEENKSLLEDFSYKINKLVQNLKEVVEIDKGNSAIQDLPEAELKKFFELIADEKLQEIKDLALKLAEKIRVAPSITLMLQVMWQEEVQKFMLDKKVKLQQSEIRSKNELISSKESELKSLNKTITSKEEEYKSNSKVKDEEIVKLNDDINKLKSDKISKDFFNKYQEIREDLEEEVAPFWQKKKENKDSESNKNKEEKKDVCIDEIRKKIETTKQFFTRSWICCIFIAIVFSVVTYQLFLVNKNAVLFWVTSVFVFVFLRCFAFRRFNLYLKIFTLRLITYAIPIFLILFHFCEFFCSEIMDQVIDKNAPDSKPYIYFHVALGATLIIAYQQLRSTISEMNIKKNLIVIYRHRELVASNYKIMSETVQDKQDKTEIIKSAAKALFENEPSIYGGNTNPMPPKVFDINNNILPRG